MLKTVPNPVLNSETFPSLLDYPFWLSKALLNTVGTDLSVFYPERVPVQGSLIIVSNHRSFLDPFVLMSALNHSVRFACHRYMGRVPLLKDVVKGLGCFSLDLSKPDQDSLFFPPVQLSQAKWLGVFPEGGEPMVKTTSPHEMGTFQRGFAHLALRSQVEPLGILPVAIVSHVEVQETTVPLEVLSWFDPSEPLFQQSGWHPAILYRRVSVLVGQPVWVTTEQRAQYYGRQAKAVAMDLTLTCQARVEALLNEGYRW
jgi:1-acyl-sn-glycerol-3-phosphate acyltransferase